MTKEKKEDKSEPTIHVDSDWKAQAQAEKEKLGKEAQQAAEPKPQAQAEALPPPSFTLLILSLVAQARICLGDLENPATKTKQLDLDSAKHNIDMLEMLDEKTKGNLSEDEKSLLDSVLYELRMRYVQLG